MTEAPSDPNHGHIRSFVLRQGRVSNAQERFLAQAMPRIGIAYQNAPLDLATAFGRDAPVILEIGFGMGETTAAIAGAHPHKNFLGIEVHTPGVGSLCKLATENNLNNVRII
ncbi:MAG: tRNA ((46)-N7)-methyltransferase TrmB, partial [Pseudomonadota bacterium]